MKGLKLSPEQWKLLAGAFSNMGQAIVLFSLAALFVPEAIGLIKSFSRFIAGGYLLAGLTVLLLGVILTEKGKR